MLGTAILPGLAQAQYTVQSGDPFSNTVPAAPADGAIIDLVGNASLTSTITLPTGAASPAADLTINAASGGSIITFSPNARFNEPNTNPVAITFGGGPVTLTGANNSVDSYGSTINSSANSSSPLATLTINVDSSLTITDNVSNGPYNGNSGGAIYSSGDLTLTVGGDVNGSGNVNYSGSVLTSTHALNLTSTTGNITMLGNTATLASPGGGGAFLSQTAMSLTAPGGNITLTNNTAVHNGGVIYAASSSGYPLTISAGGAITITGNVATNSVSGAIFVNGGAPTITAPIIDIENNFAGYSVNSGASPPYTASNVTPYTAVTASGGAINTAPSGSMTGLTATTGQNALLSGNAITLSSNQAMLNGGGIYSGSTLLQISGALTADKNLAANGNGGAIWAAGSVELDATSSPGMSFSGNTQNAAGTTPQANAMYLDNLGGGSTLTLNAAGNPITFYDPIQSNPVNGLISVLVEDAGGDTVAFDGSQYTAATDQWSQVYGSTEVQSGVLAVQNNAVYGVLAADVTQTATTSFTVDAGATLAGGGTTTPVGTVRADTFTLAGTLNIAGSATPLGSATGGFSTFNVVSGGETLTGGTVVFNTCLNDAATSQSDVLVLDANNATSATTGTARIQVRNVGGAGCAGALTSGDGILLVNAIDGATTQTTAFQLAATVAAGGYGYALVQGGADGSAQKAQNWYLRSTLLPVPIAVPALDRAAIVALLALLIGAAARRRRWPARH